MKVMLFSIFDMAAARYMDPFCAPTIDFALRGFRAACETDGHDFMKYPEDYSLYYVGDFDPELGVIIEATAVKIGLATQFKQKYDGNLELDRMAEG